MGEVAEEELSPYYYGYEELFEFLNLNEISNDDIRQIMMDKAIQSVAWAENHTIWHDCKKELPTDIDNKYIYIEYYSHNQAGHPFNKRICVIGTNMVEQIDLTDIKIPVGYYDGKTNQKH